MRVCVLDRGGNRGRYGNFNNEDGGGGGGGRSYDRGGPQNRDGDDRYNNQNRYNRNDRDDGDRPPADRAPHTASSEYMCGAVKLCKTFKKKTTISIILSFETVCVQSFTNYRISLFSVLPQMMREGPG